MDQSLIRIREKYCGYKDILKLKTNIRSVFCDMQDSQGLSRPVLVFSFSAVNTYLALHYSGYPKNQVSSPLQKPSQ